MSGKAWSTEDENTLRDIMRKNPWMSYDEIQKNYLPHKTLFAVERKANRMGLKRNTRAFSDTDELAYSLYTRWNGSLADLFRICYPGKNYANCHKRLMRIVEIKKANEKDGA